MKVLITGASSGMGRDMAKYLYSFGYDLYLVAKDKSKLDNEFKGYDRVHTYSYNLINVSSNLTITGAKTISSFILDPGTYTLSAKEIISPAETQLFLLYYLLLAQQYLL